MAMAHGDVATAGDRERSAACNAAAKRNCRNRYEKTTIALCDLVSNKVRFLSMWYDALQGSIILLSIT